MPLDKEDRELIRRAEELIRERYRQGRHEIGAALRGRSGEVYATVHVEGSLKNCTLCAEWGALSWALSRGEDRFDAIVALKYYPESGRAFIVPPCGICRELLSDFGPVDVIVQEGRKLLRRPVSALLPQRYTDRRAQLRRRNGSGK